MVTPDNAERVWKVMQLDLMLFGYTRDEALSIIVPMGYMLVDFGITTRSDTSDPLFIEALKRSASLFELVNEDKI